MATMPEVLSEQIHEMMGDGPEMDRHLSVVSTDETSQMASPQPMSELERKIVNGFLTALLSEDVQKELMAAAEEADGMSPKGLEANLAELSGRIQCKTVGGEGSQLKVVTNGGEVVGEAPTPFLSVLTLAADLGEDCDPTVRYRLQLHHAALRRLPARLGMQSPW